jgi:hypothetical protein
VQPRAQLVLHYCQRQALILAEAPRQCSKRTTLERSTAGIRACEGCNSLGSVCVSALPDVGVRSCVARAILPVNAIMQHDWSHVESITSSPSHTPLSSRIAAQASHKHHAIRCFVFVVGRHVCTSHAWTNSSGQRAETETPIMTSTLWRFQCSLQRRTNGAKS